MAEDPELVAEAALAILHLTLHDDGKAWKSLPWQMTDRLQQKGLIMDPRNKNKSLVFTGEGIEAARRAYRRLFEKKG